MQVGGWVWEGGGLRSASTMRRGRSLRITERRERQEWELRRVVYFRLETRILRRGRGVYYLPVMPAKKGLSKRTCEIEVTWPSDGGREFIRLRPRRVEGLLTRVLFFERTFLLRVPRMGMISLTRDDAPFGDDV